MDQSNEILQAILSDPERLSAAVNMVSGLLGQKSETPTEEKTELPEPQAAPKKDVDAVALLKALKPFLSKERQDKVDRAVKMLALADIAMELKDIFQVI